MVCIGLALAVLSPLISPASIPALPLFGLAYPILMILATLLLIYWLFAAPKRSFLPLIMLLIGMVYSTRYFSLGGSSSGTQESVCTVATYNLSNALSGYDRIETVRETKRQLLEDYLHQLRPTDIICVQERGAFASEVLASVFNEHQLHSHKAKGTAILSRYPIVDSGIIDFGTKTNSCVWADLTIGSSTVRVYSVHLQSNMITQDTKRLMEGDAIPSKKSPLSRLRRVVGNFLTNHRKRIAQSKLIKQHVDQSPHPVIVCGDFNDTPMSTTYQTFATDLQDSFVSRGRGFASTFAGHIPFLRIDYVWASPSFDFRSHEVLKEQVYSDHYPVVVELSIP